MCVILIIKILINLTSLFDDLFVNTWLPLKLNLIPFLPFQGTPTVVPLANFDATSDAQILRKAMKGFGTDEDAIINVICRRSNEQRQLIARAYKTNFGKDLLEDLKSECSGNFEKLLIALMTPIVDFYAQELHDAMSGAGTDEDVLVEVLATMSNYEIHTIKNAYERSEY